MRKELLLAKVPVPQLETVRICVESEADMLAKGNDSYFGATWPQTLCL